MGLFSLFPFTTGGESTIDKGQQRLNGSHEFKFLPGAIFHFNPFAVGPESWDHLTSGNFLENVLHLTSSKMWPTSPSSL